MLNHTIILLQTWSFDECGNTLSLWSLPGQLWIRVVSLVRIPSMSQIFWIIYYTWTYSTAGKRIINIKMNY